jgi:paraquat-inducible protein B
VTDPSPPAPSPEIRTAQRWNIVWVVPILAILIGGWLIYQNVSSVGPVARVRFDTADGIAAGKTEVRCRSVRVGTVEEVELAPDLNSVLVHIRMDGHAENLLRRGTRFWVVRPRVSGTDISGLGTLITGAYIEMEPGTSPEPWTKFRGRETPPTTNRSIPGLRFTLNADDAGSLTAGSPIYYLGFEVGRIETRKLDLAQNRVVYEAFIKENYRSLVTESTRFWNTSGIDISAGADGFRVRTPSFQAMVSGGISFGLPDGLPPGNAATDDAVFTLFPDESSARSSTFNPSLRFLLLFNQSVRGLVKDAPVEFRGIRIGRVADISFNYLPSSLDQRIPVLIEIDPALLRNETANNLSNTESTFLSDAVAKGLRASLKTGSYLTGALFVDLDYYEDSPPAELGTIGELTTVPTVSSGFAQLESKLSAILDKFQQLPLDETLTKFTAAADESAKTIAEARNTLKEIESVAQSAREILDDPQFKAIPADLRQTLDQLNESIASIGPEGAMQGDLLRTLDELRASLRSIKTLTNSLEEKPNSLLFGRESSGNPTPRAPRGR